MIRFIVFSIIVSFFNSCSESTKYMYPEISKLNTIDNYHGIKIEDPYRNLENLEDTKVINWLKEQNKYANNYLENIRNRETIFNKLKEYDNENKFKIYKLRATENKGYFYLKKDIKENITKLYYLSDVNTVESLLFDPETYKKGLKKRYTINYFKPDWNAEQIVISLSQKGSEISELILLDSRTKKITYDITKSAAPHILDGVYWLSDNSGFIYQSVPFVKPNEVSYLQDTESVLYRIGINSKKPTVLLSRLNNPSLKLSKEDFPIIYYKDKKDPYLFTQISGPTPYGDNYYANLIGISKNRLNWKLLFTKNEKISKYVYQDSSLIYLTAKNASNFKICKTSILKPDFSNPEVLVVEKNDRVIKDFEFTKNGLFYTTVKNGVEANLYVLNKGQEKEVKLPRSSGKVSISSEGINSDQLFVITSGWTSPKKYYSCSTTDHIFEEIRLNPISIHKDFKDVKIEEVEAKSHDGALVPLSIIYKENIKLDGKNPTMLVGYGAYGTTYRPSFNKYYLTWVTEGGILAIAHVRGGGEKGNAWYEGGLKTTKENTWKDAIACTEYLIEKGYTSMNKTAIWGTSAGGIMVGRAITERPDLYKVAIANVPAMNMLRSEAQVNGANSAKEYGSVRDSIEFRALLKMDSYHNIVKGESYPATLVSSGYKDSRVAAWDPAKFVAKLQESNDSSNPILFSIDFDEGHTTSDNKIKNYTKYTDFFSFAFWQTGHPDYQPKN